MQAPTVPLRWESQGLTHVGAVRTNNEDAFLDRPAAGVWAVADGMGGHASGEVASRMVVEQLAQLPDDGSLSLLVDAAEDRLLEVNRQLLTLAMHFKERAIGSTVVTLLARGRHAACLWAGDSRLYRLRAGRIERLTRDHAMVEDLVASGLLKRDAAATHPGANQITRAIGVSPSLFLEVELFEAQSGDVYLLCSDGLYRELKDAEIAAVLNDDAPNLKRLLETALERQPHDNLTAVAVRCR